MQYPPTQPLRCTWAAWTVLALAACAPEAELSEVQQCVSTSPIAAIDHVTLAVLDLAEARSQVQDLGFRIKAGRLHGNGILNAHAKTHQGSLELLTIADEGAPDPQSREYAEFLAEGEGGAFLALAASPVDSVVARLEPLGVEFDVERSAAWDYLTFPRGSALRHLYFIDLKQPVEDGDEVLTHMNGASRISGVALDGGPQLVGVLEAVGASVCEATDQATRLELGEVSLVLHPHDPATRGRVRGVEFDVFTLGRPPAIVRGLTLSWTTSN